jgi:hypothetical protein
VDSVLSADREAPCTPSRKIPLSDNPVKSRLANAEFVGQGNAAIDTMRKTIGEEIKPWLGFAQVVTTTLAVTEKAEPKTVKDEGKGK